MQIVEMDLHFKAAIILAVPPEFATHEDETGIDAVLADLSDMGIDSLEDLKVGYGGKGGDDKLAALMSAYDSDSPTAGAAPGILELLAQVVPHL